MPLFYKTKMRIIKVLFLTILFSLQTISVLSQQEKRVEFVYAPVSPIHLIANPEKYDGKRVRLRGFLHYQFEDSALYLSKDDADYLNSANAIWIRYDKTVKLEILVCKNIKEITKPTADDFKYFDGRYVTVEGIFNMKGRGHLGVFSGELDNVVRLEEDRQWFDGKKEVAVIDKDGKVVSKDKCQ